MTSGKIQIPEGWTIQRDIKPIPDRQFDYSFWHEDYDGENGLCGLASSVEHAIELIDEIEEDAEDVPEVFPGTVDAISALSAFK